MEIFEEEELDELSSSLNHFLSLIKSEQLIKIDYDVKIATKLNGEIFRLYWAYILYSYGD